MRKIRAKVLRQLAYQLALPGIPVKRIYRMLKRFSNKKTTTLGK